MDVSPTVNLLRSYRGNSVSYEMLICEAVDNSLDAGATRIEIRLSADSVTVSDNGHGITKAQFRSIFVIDHGTIHPTQLGRFGLGIKVHAINAGDVFTVTSNSSDGCTKAEVNWVDVMRSGLWEMDAPIWQPSLVGSPTGTTVTISKLRFPPKITMDHLLTKLADTFYPAISNGVVITLNRTQVPCLRDPELTDVVDISMELSGGRGAHLRAGILVVTPGSLNLVNVSYRHRVIMPESTVGCGAYNGLYKMFARLQLTGPWHLGRFKDDLPDENERDELEDAVLAQLTPILEKCSNTPIGWRWSGSR